QSLACLMANLWLFVLQCLDPVAKRLACKIGRFVILAEASSGHGKRQRHDAKVLNHGHAELPPSPKGRNKSCGIRMLRPFRAQISFRPAFPRALPWADLFWPFRPGKRATGYARS